MNKLIKFVSLVAILFSNLSLSAVMEEPTSLASEPINFSAGRGLLHLHPEQFLLVPYMNTFSLDIEKIEEIEGNVISYDKIKALSLLINNRPLVTADYLASLEPQITINLLQKNKLIKVVFANAETCRKNSALLKVLTENYIPNFRNNPEKYVEIARSIIKKEGPSNVRSRLTALNTSVSTFFENYSYARAFLFSLSLISIHKNGTLYANAVYPNMQISYFDSQIICLVATAIEKRLGCDQDGFTEEKFRKLLFDNLTNIDIVVYTMCEMRELLKAIDNVLASAETN